MRRAMYFIILVICGACAILFAKDILKTGFPRKYRSIVTTESLKYQMDEYLVYSVIRAESRYDGYAVSYAGAKGLMQITDDTFEMIRSNIDIGDDVFDPQTNIEAGVWYLFYLFTQLGDIEDTVKAYNCGLNNLGSMIIQTEIFHSRVFEFYDIYTYLYLD